MQTAIRPFTHPDDNSNCLQRMRCPTCPNTRHFSVQMSGFLTLTDDGTGDTGDTNFEDDSLCECPECGFSGQAGEFSIDVLEIFVAAQSHDDSKAAILITLPRFTAERYLARSVSEFQNQRFVSITERFGFRVDQFTEDGGRDVLDVALQKVCASRDGLAFEFKCHDSFYVTQVIDWRRLKAATAGEVVGGESFVLPECEISSIGGAR